MSEPTPGEIAYETYVAHTQQQPALLPWRYVQPHEHAAWEAAAQAVGATTRAQCLPYRYRLGQQVWWACEPEEVWRITYRASHENRAEGLRLYYGIKGEGSRLIRMAEESELSIREDDYA